MAKLVCSFDTETKKMDVTLDGEAVANANMYSVSPSWSADEEFEIRVYCTEKDEASDITKMTVLCASAKEGVRKVEPTAAELAKFEAKASPVKGLAKLVAKAAGK